MKDEPDGVTPDGVTLGAARNPAIGPAMNRAGRQDVGWDKRSFAIAGPPSLARVFAKEEFQADFSPQRHVALNPPPWRRNTKKGKRDPQMTPSSPI